LTGRNAGELARLRAEVQNLRQKKAGGEALIAGPGRITSDPIQQTALEAFLHFTGWSHASIRVIAERIAGQPVRVGRRVQAKRPPAGAKRHVEPELQLLDRHPLLDALRDPNPIMVHWSLMFITVAGLELAGRYYWWLTTEKDRVQIWPLPPQWVRPEHDEDKLYARYVVTPAHTGRLFTLPPEEVLHFYYPSPGDPYLGAISPLWAQSRAVSADEAIVESQARTFSNGAHPGLAIIVGRHPDAQGTPGQRPVLNKVQRDQLITAIKQMYGGVVNYNEPLILDGLIEDVKPISTNPKELDYLNSSVTSKGRITQGFGVNPIVMGEIQGANRASAVAASEHLNEYTINPKAVLLSQVMTAWFREYFADPELEVFIEKAVASDVDAKRADLQQLIGAQAITLDELRKAHGLPPLKTGGEVLVSPGAQQPMEGVAGLNARQTFPGLEEGGRGNLAETARGGGAVFRNGTH
jgi:phage portal protein BeeE